MGTEAIGPTNDGPQRRTMMRLILNRSRSLGRAALIAGMAALPMSLPAMAQQHGGTLIAAFSADPAGFDPVRGPERHVACRDRAGLFDADGARPGRQALSRTSPRAYEMSPDGLEYTFKLREGVKFHNGDAAHRRGRQVHLRPAARARIPAIPTARRSRPSPSVDVVDPLTVKFKLSQAHRSVPDLHGVPRLLDRAEEAGRIRP